MLFNLPFGTGSGGPRGGATTGTAAAVAAQSAHAVEFQEELRVLTLLPALQSGNVDGELATVS